MKEWQKMEVPRRNMMALLFSLVMFSLGVILGIAQERYVNGKKANECQVQPQPTPPVPDAPKPPAHECIVEPPNPLRNITDRVERGMTKERLERNIAELDDGRLSPVVVRKERVTLANRASYAMEYWSWNLEMKKAEGETWNIALTLDLCEDRVVGIHYTSDYNVAGTAIHK